MEKNSYSVYDTSISFTNHTERKVDGDWLHWKFAHYAYFYRCMNLLSSEGFSVGKDPDVPKIIRSDYWIGKRCDLEFEASKYPNRFEINFFQNINYVNPNGGRHDFDKYEKMPYIIRLQFLKYRRKIVGLLKELVPDISDETKQYPKFAEDWVKYRYVEDGRVKHSDIHFDLRDYDGLAQISYNGTDRDGKGLRNGETKYFRGYDGYLCRGRIYHNCNNMWWVITDKYTVRNIACFELFDLLPEDCRRRMKKASIPIEYQERRRAIEKSKNKELIAELRRRGLKFLAKEGSA